MNPTGHLVLNMLAGAALFALAWPRLRRLGYSIYDEIDGAFYLLMGIVAGAWAANALPRIVDAASGGQRYIPWWAAGEHWLGAVAGGALVGYLWVRRRGFPVGASFDALAPLLPICLAIIRIGCLLNADSHGRPTESWPGMWLPDPNGTYALRYPTQLVSLAMNLLLAALLFGFEFWTHRQGRPPGWPFPGFLFLLYVELYCLGRFYFEFWRADMYPWVGQLTYTHLYCIAGIALATWATWRGLRRARHPGAHTAGALNANP
jgi:prolipoprotein diacylglyceryltransferase